MKHIIISALYLLTLFCLSKFVFEPTFLYSELKWLDIPMHIMGGFGATAFIGAILSYKKIKVSYKRLFFAYAVVAITWEVYEYFFNPMFVKEWASWLDTFKDFIDGWIGVSVAYLFVRK